MSVEVVGYESLADEVRKDEACLKKVDWATEYIGPTLKDVTCQMRIGIIGDDAEARLVCGDNQTRGLFRTPLTDEGVGSRLCQGLDAQLDVREKRRVWGIAKSQWTHDDDGYVGSYSWMTRKALERLEPTHTPCKIPQAVIPQVETLDKCIANSKSSMEYECSSEISALGRALRENGSEYLGQGLFRFVYSLGDKCVIKIGRGRMGANNNRDEWKGWQRIRKTKDPRVVRLFAPLVSISERGGVLVAAQVRIPDEWQTKRVANEVNREMERLNVACEDVHEANVGFIRNRPVILDYGAGARCNVKYNEA